MAHTHFNGACEQSARNYHGAISRNFGPSDRLGTRLSCQKPVAQYNRAFSGCLVPLEYDEDPDYETPRGVFIKNGFHRAREVRAFCNETIVFAEPKADTLPAVTAHKVIPETICVVLGKVTRKETVTRKEAAQVVEFIRTCPRISKPIRDKFLSRKIGAIAALRMAGLYTVK